VTTKRVTVIVSKNLETRFERVGFGSGSRTYDYRPWQNYRCASAVRLWLKPCQFLLAVIRKHDDNYDVLQCASFARDIQH
jgi:hypothetical protein